MRTKIACFMLVVMLSGAFYGLRPTNAADVSPNAGQKSISVYLNGNLVKTDVPPETVNGRTMVPLRVISENLGAEVSWEAAAKKVTITKGDTTLILQIGENVSQKITPSGSTDIKIDAAPYIKDGRVLAPLRYLSESMGLNVAWDEAERSVYIAKSLTDGVDVKYYNWYGDKNPAETYPRRIQMGRFRCGLAPVINEDGKVGYIDKLANLVIDYQFDGIANNTDSSQQDFIHPDPGNRNTEVYMYRFEFTDYGYAFVKKDGELFYIDTKGNKIDNTFSGKYYKAGPFVNGRAAAQKTENGLLGYIDEQGNPITEFKYLSASNFKTGVAKAIEAVPFVNGKSKFVPSFDGMGPYNYHLNPIREMYMPMDADVIDVYLDTSGSVLFWKLHEQDGRDYQQGTITTDMISWGPDKQKDRIDLNFRTGIIFELDEVSQGLIQKNYTEDGRTRFFYITPNGKTAIEFDENTRINRTEPFSATGIAAVTCREDDKSVVKYINNKGEFLDENQLAIRFPFLFVKIEEKGIRDENGEYRKKVWLVDKDGQLISDVTDLDKEIFFMLYSSSPEDYYDHTAGGLSWSKGADDNIFYITYRSDIHDYGRIIGYVVIDIE